MGETATRPAMISGACFCDMQTMLSFEDGDCKQSQDLPIFCGEGLEMEALSQCVNVVPHPLSSSHFSAPHSSCFKSLGFRVTYLWLICGVSECVTTVPGRPRMLGPHYCQVQRVLIALTYNISVMKYVIFNLYRIFRNIALKL